MALVQTIAEVKAVHPRLLSNTSSTAWMPNMEAAEYKYLVPLVGLPLYNDIHTKYTSNPVSLAGLSTIEKALRLKMIAVTVAAAYMDELSRNTAKITDNGVRTANSADMQRIFGWEYKEFKQGITDLYYDSIEVMLQWLFDNKASFTLWTNDASYTKFNNLLIKTGTDFTEQYRLYQPLRMYWMLRGIVQDVQDNYHALALGADLLTYFVNLTSPTAAEKEIIRALKKSIAFLTVYRTCRIHAVRFSDAGFSIIASETDAQSSTQAASPVAMLEHHMRMAQEDGLQQLERGKRLCRELRADGTVTAFNTAYDLGPLLATTAPDAAAKNATLVTGFRMGV